MIISLLLLATLPLRNRSGWFCSVAKDSLHRSANQALRKRQAFGAVLQKSHCETATLALQDGRTGSISSRNIIKESIQGVSSEESMTMPLTVEVG